MLKFNVLTLPQFWTESLTISDQSLVSLYLDGHPATIQLIDDWISAAAHPYKQRLGHSWEDVLQDVRIKVFTFFQKQGFLGDKGLKTYIWKMVNHTCIDHFRKKSRRQFTGFEDLENSEQALSKQLSPDEKTQLRKGLWLLWRQVPQACRQLWRMLLNGEDYSEMSKVLDISEATLRVRVYRCRKEANALRDRAGL